MHACASVSSENELEYVALGYLSATPTSESIRIGEFDNSDECRAAADEWASRQVVGNPVVANCYRNDAH